MTTYPASTPLAQEPEADLVGRFAYPVEDGERDRVDPLVIVAEFVKRIVVGALAGDGTDVRYRGM